MKSTKNLAIGFALCLGLVACGQNSHKEDAAAPTTTTPAGLIEVNAPVAKVADLKAASDKILGDISQVTAAIGASQDPAQKDQLNAELKALKTEYAKAQDALTDAEGYQLLLQFVIDNQVTALDQLPAKFQTAKVEEQKKVDEIKAQEQSFLTKIEDSINTVTEAKVVLKSVDRTLRQKAAALAAKTQLSPEEQQQLDAIRSFIDSQKQLVEKRSALTVAQNQARVLEEKLAADQKIKTDLMTQKTALIRQLLQVSADDAQGREQILQNIEKIQDQMVDIDLTIYDSKTALESNKTMVSEYQKSIESLKSTVDSVVPGLSSISGTDLVAAMKKAEDADLTFQTLQTDYQKWRQDLSAAEMTLDNISKLEAFFALKYPDVKPGQPTGEPTQPQPQPEPAPTTAS